MKKQLAADIRGYATGEALDLLSITIDVQSAKWGHNHDNWDKVSQILSLTGLEPKLMGQKSKALPLSSLFYIKQLMQHCTSHHKTFPSIPDPIPQYCVKFETTVQNMCIYRITKVKIVLNFAKTTNYTFNIII